MGSVWFYNIKFLSDTAFSSVFSVFVSVIVSSASDVSSASSSNSISVSVVAIRRFLLCLLDIPLE